MYGTLRLNTRTQCAYILLKILSRVAAFFGTRQAFILLSRECCREAEMSIQPIDLAALLAAVTWPLIIVVAFTVFRHPLSELVGTFGQRARKFSFGGVSLELAEVSEMRPQSLEAEIRQLDAGLIPQSGSSAIAGLLKQLQSGGEYDYIVIDLGSESSPRWLTSRLYLLAFLIAPIDRPKCFVFLETVGSVRKRFVGTASPHRVRWALVRRYGWLESASVAAYESLGGLQLDPGTGNTLLH
jgi:hypothetical protein